MTVEYWIDADDVITRVGAGWAEFAADNGAPELAAAGPGASLWSQVASAEVADLWRVILGDVRASGRPIRTEHRCDAPAWRRWCELTVHPAPDGGIHFRSVVLRKEERVPISVLDPSTARDDEAALIRVCSWCSRFWTGRDWVRPEDYLAATAVLEHTRLPGITHGICPDCAERVGRELDLT